MNMSFTEIMPYIQIILSVLLIGGILLQRSEAGLGGAFGGDNFTSAKYTKRGAEKVIFIITIILGILFVLSSIAILLL
jgi:protein translocase SecG subunit